MWYKKIVKPALDVMMAFLVLIIISPVAIGLMFILWIKNNGKIFFVQERPGLEGKIFKLYKFKTMTDDKDHDGKLLPDFRRQTNVGRFMRKFSLDEIPQLFNVLKGDMSLVGPRPLLVQYLPLYNEVQKRRHEVKPGITGWAQVNGRNAISWQEKFNYDIEYVDCVNLKMDIKILLLTIKKVFQSEGVNKDSTITMEVFKGN